MTNECPPDQVSGPVAGFAQGRHGVAEPHVRAILGDGRQAAIGLEIEGQRVHQEGMLAAGPGPLTFEGPDGLPAALRPRERLHPLEGLNVLRPVDSRRLAVGRLEAAAVLPGKEVKVHLSAIRMHAQLNNAAAAPLGQLRSVLTELIPGCWPLLCVEPGFFQQVFVSVQETHVGGSRDRVVFAIYDAAGLFERSFHMALPVILVALG
jgi:hypothetical protein